MQSLPLFPSPPGVAVHRLLARRVRSMMLTSGTLSPLESFAAELQLGFRHTLENPHIIEPHQVGVGGKIGRRGRGRERAKGMGLGCSGCTQENTTTLSHTR